MISFKKFLRLHEEVVSTRRQGIQHLQEMPPEIFIQWMRSVRNELGGVLKNIKSVMKIDGIGFRFGKDISGKVFIEGSRTGPISEVGAFSAYAKNKNDMTAKIIIPLKKLVEKYCDKDLMFTCSGSLTSFSIRLSPGKVRFGIVRALS